MTTAGDVKKELKTKAKIKDARILQWFFKTGPGEYGEGDRFIGVRVPVIRQIVKQSFRDISLSEILILLKSPVHEERLTALLIMVFKYQKADDPLQSEIYKAYLSHTRYINNWDLVDLSALHIVGAYLEKRERNRLYALVRSKSLWERRIAVLATFYFIRHNDFDDALALAKTLLGDKEDLIHKAVGWMLREIGKRDMPREEAFLKTVYRQMPRTMLRYAIERFPETKRRAYLEGTVRAEVEA